MIKFCLGTRISSTNETYYHDVHEIMLKVVLISHNPSISLLAFIYKVDISLLAPKNISIFKYTCSSLIMLVTKVNGLYLVAVKMVVIVLEMVSFTESCFLCLLCDVDDFIFRSVFNLYLYLI